VALVPDASGLSASGGSLPTSGLPGGYAPTFTSIDTDAVRDAAVDPLAGYDTVVLNGICNISEFLARPLFESRIEGFVGRGGKLIIWDSECTVTDYSNFAIPFRTNNPGAHGAHSGTLIDLEDNTLSSENPASASYINLASVVSRTDAVGDANVFTTYDKRWFADLEATNVEGVNGPVQAYARLGTGLIIYSGFDRDDMGSGFEPDSTSGDDQLARIWLGELLQPSNPDGLPRTVSATTRYKYVALGDSFSSGEGVEPFFVKGTNTCHRSMKAYPTLVELPGFDGSSIFALSKAGIPGIAWGFQACSGAGPDDLLGSFQPAGGSGPTDYIGDGVHRDLLRQLADTPTPDPGNPNRLNVDAQTDLVTMTIGGNDMNWPDVILYCAIHPTCSTGAYKGSKSLDAYLRHQRYRLAPKLDSILARIALQAPRARILLVGYPNLVPASAIEQRCLHVTVAGYPFGLSSSEQSFTRRSTRALNQVIKASAGAAPRTADGSPRATYVPVDKIFAGHEICGRYGPWINYPTPTRRGSFGPNDQSFHPTACGQQAYAAAINDVLNPGRLAPTIGSSRCATVHIHGLVGLRLPIILCPIRSPACVIAVTARARIPGIGSAVKKLKKIGSATLSVLPGAARAIEFKLNKIGRRALKHGKKVGATVTAVAVHGSQSVTRTVKVVLKTPKRLLRTRR
jgi:lysophospholipase L1-like esterase